jgi:acyl carrier protein
MTLQSEVEAWVTSKVVETSRSRLPAESVHAATQLRRDLGLTSLQAVSVILDVEERFGIEVVDEDLAALATVGDIVALVLARVNQNLAGSR